MTTPRSPAWRASPTSAEVVALTRENPKGKLLEFCARAKCGPPAIEAVHGNTLSGARMTLTVEGQAFDSDMHWAPERIVAEQLAARALLQALAQTEDADPVAWVDEESAAGLRQTNPKGALLEICVRLGMTPRFEVRPVVTAQGAGFEAGVFVERAEGEELWGDLRRAREAKIAEQATAASLLELLWKVDEDRPREPAHSVTGLEPRSALNEMQQRGTLRAYGFALERVEGPPHAPVFFMNGFVELRIGDRIEVTSIEAPSKKEAERRAAAQLLERLRERSSRPTS
jgi:dsRNA-specific ribonuclease